MPELNVFQPVPELQTNNSDLGLRLTGMNSVLYANPVDDPMFSAHRQIIIPTQTNDSSVFYESDFPGSAMACAVQVSDFSSIRGRRAHKMQHQYCLHKKQCTELGPARMPSDLYKLLPEANAVQKAILAVLAQTRDYRAIYSSDNYEAEESRGGWPYIVSLPDDQWIKELKRWESSVWATFQIGLSYYATGPQISGSPSKENYTIPKTEGEKKLCGMQKMRKSGGFV